MKEDDQYIEEYKLKFPDRFKWVKWYQYISWISIEEKISDCLEAINDLPNNTLSHKKYRLLKSIELEDYYRSILNEWSKRLNITRFNKYEFKRKTISVDEYAALYVNNDDDSIEELLHDPNVTIGQLRWEKWTEENEITFIEGILLCGKLIHELPIDVQEFIWNKEREYSKKFRDAQNILISIYDLQQKLRNQIQFLEGEEPAPIQNNGSISLNEILKNAGIKKDMNGIMKKISCLPFGDKDLIYVKDNDGKFQWDIEKPGIVYVIAGLLRVIQNELERTQKQKYFQSQDNLFKCFKDEYPYFTKGDRSSISKVPQEYYEYAKDVTMR